MITPYTQAAQSDVKNTYVPLPFQQMTQVAMMKDQAYSDFTNKIDEYGSKLQSMQAIPGSKDEQYVKGLKDVVDKTVTKYTGQDLADPTVQRKLKSELSQVVDPQRLNKIQQSYMNYQQYKEEVKRLGKDHDEIMDTLMPFANHDSNIRLWEGSAAGYMGAEKELMDIKSKLNPTILKDHGDGYYDFGINKDMIANVAGQNADTFASTLPGQYQIERYKKIYAKSDPTRLHNYEKQSNGKYEDKGEKSNVQIAAEILQDRLAGMEYKDRKGSYDLDAKDKHLAFKLQSQQEETAPYSHTEEVLDQLNYNKETTGKAEANISRDHVAANFEEDPKDKSSFLVPADKKLKFKPGEYDVNAGKLEAKRRELVEYERLGNEYKKAQDNIEVLEKNSKRLSQSDWPDFREQGTPKNISKAKVQLMQIDLHRKQQEIKLMNLGLRPSEYNKFETRRDIKKAAAESTRKGLAMDVIPANVSFRPHNGMNLEAIDNDTYLKEEVTFTKRDLMNSIMLKKAQDPNYKGYTYEEFLQTLGDNVKISDVQSKGNKPTTIETKITIPTAYMEYNLKDPEANLKADAEVSNKMGYPHENIVKLQTKWSNVDATNKYNAEYAKAPVEIESIKPAKDGKGYILTRNGKNYLYSKDELKKKLDYYIWFEQQMNGHTGKKNTYLEEKAKAAEVKFLQ